MGLPWGCDRVVRGHGLVKVWVVVLVLGLWRVEVVGEGGKGCEQRGGWEGAWQWLVWRCGSWLWLWHGGALGLECWWWLLWGEGLVLWQVGLELVLGVWLQLWQVGLGLVLEVWLPLWQVGLELVWVPWAVGDVQWTV